MMDYKYIQELRNNHLAIAFVTVFCFLIWYIYTQHINKTERFEALDDKERRIDNGDWSYADKFIYGGLGYGNMCLPSNLFRVIATIIFPPMGIIINYVESLDVFPYLSLINLIKNIDELLMSIVLTAFFYVPGLIYSLNKIKCGSCSSSKSPS